MTNVMGQSLFFPCISMEETCPYSLKAAYYMVVLSIPNDCHYQDFSLHRSHVTLTSFSRSQVKVKVSNVIQWEKDLLII